MSELLQNETLQQALVALIVVALTAAANWVRSKTSQTAIVNEWWCYIQPAVNWASEEALARAKEGFKIGKHTELFAIASQAVVRFAEDYLKNEGKEPSTTVVAAAESEIVDRLNREA